MSLGPVCEERMLEAVRREAEQCDFVQGIFCVASVAGGTGSGLGSYTMQLLQDMLPRKPLAAGLVWPFASGEVSVQALNAALALASAQETADVVVVAENSKVLALCRRQYSLANPTYADMNAAISTGLAHAAFPADGTGTTWPALCAQLGAHPGYKLCTVRAVPQVS